MKNGIVRGWTKVFSFTLRQQMRQKGYRLATILTAVILLVAIAGGMLLFDTLVVRKTDEPGSRIERAVIVDNMPGEIDWNFLAWIGGTTDTTHAGTLEEALAEAGPTGVVLLLEESGSRVLLPEESVIDWDDAENWAKEAGQWLPYAYAVKSGLDPAQLSEIYTPVFSGVDSGEEDAPGGLVGEVLQMVLPYLVVMLVYFFVLVYGQSVANSVILEKTSKLMDTFLISVKPAGLMLGKLLAIALAGIIQMLVWGAGVVGGLLLGRALVLAGNPTSQMGLIAFMDLLGSLGGMFTPAAVVMAVLLLISGFLLYCSLSAFGGAMAGKPEDLSTTNVFFTAFIVASLFAIIYGSGASGGMVSEAAWLNWVPFTAVMVAPGRVLLGQLSPLGAVGPLAVVLVVSLVFTILAGKVYTLMAFWRGDPPKPGKVLAMLRGSKANHA